MVTVVRSEMAEASDEQTKAVISLGIHVATLLRVIGTRAPDGATAIAAVLSGVTAFLCDIAKEGHEAIVLEKAGHELLSYAKQIAEANALKEAKGKTKN